VNTDVRVEIRAEFERDHQALIEAGYEDVAEYAGIKVGARVRHVGHQWPEAFERGSATVLAVMRKDPSAWAQTYRRPDVELLVELDRPFIAGSCLAQLADYHVLVIPAPEQANGGVE
jgi:hypothetical protein